MADEDSGGSGFGWGFVFGLAIGVVAGALIGSGPGREQVEGLRARTIELTGSARRAASDPEHPVRRAIQDGVTAARKKRDELDQGEPTRVTTIPTEPKADA